MSTEQDLIQLDPLLQQRSPTASLPYADPTQVISSLIEQIRPLLPIQNPIPFFVHNNPLMYWEKYSFDEGVLSAIQIYKDLNFSFNRPLARTLEDTAIPIISSYLDQGLSSFHHQRHMSLWDWFCEFVNETSIIKGSFIRKLKAELPTLQGQGSLQTLTSITELRSKELGWDWNEYLMRLLFHFKGWSGIVNQLEIHPRLFPLHPMPIKLIDWLAMLATIENSLRVASAQQNTDVQLTSTATINNQLQIMRERERVFFSANIQKLKTHIQKPKESESSEPETQILFCIDDREESLRRYLEEVYHECATFGAVGFFGVDVQIRHAGQMIYQDSCPPVIKPRMQVSELPKTEIQKSWIGRCMTKINSLINHSRFSWHEPLVALFLFPVVAANLVLRTLSSKISYRLNSGITEDQCRYEFVSNQGFSVAQKAQIVFDLLTGAGLKNHFAPVVVMMGHGATTTNNAFQKAYGCGACSGQSGFANARLFCEFANSNEVRDELAQKGLVVPNATIFVAACHDTCCDEVRFALDGVVLDSTQGAIAEKLKIKLTQALKKNATHRLNQFGVQSTDWPVDRAWDWSQPRPEFGHSKVALAFFGPRQLTEGYNFDRRCFLISYDPLIDQDGSRLSLVINGALPVCANINLDYLTSSAFSSAFGSGSKLPMNAVAGIGLMTGSKSDLRIGLANQMVEMHEPIRLLAFVYAHKEHLDHVLSNSNRLKNLIENNWIHLVRIDPHDLSFVPVTSEIQHAL